MINYELFQLIEKSGERGMTAKELSEHTGIPVAHVGNWCSRWTKRRFLKKSPPEEPEWIRPIGRPESRYACGNKEWASLVNKEYLSDQ